MAAETTASSNALNGDLRFLDPRVFARLQSLEMIAKFIVEGFMLGLHRSPYHGFSVEFSSYRKYSPGDNLRFVDWKLFARTDRFYVKQFEENTNLACYLLLDKSGSMSIGDEGVTKFRYATCLSAALTHLMLKQKDAVGLAAFDSEGVDFIPASAKSTQRRHLLLTLDKLECKSQTDFSSGLESVASRINRRGLIILISDLLDDVDSILNILKYFRYKKHEVVVFHVMSDLEMEFPFREQHQFVDAETGQKLITSASVIRREYLDALHQHIDSLRKGCLDMEVDFVPIRVMDEISEALIAYLSMRQHVY